MLETTQLLAADSLAREITGALRLAESATLGTVEQLAEELDAQLVKVRAALNHYAELRMFCKDTCPDCHCELGTNTEACQRCAHTQWLCNELEKAPDTERSLSTQSKAEYDAHVASQT